MNERYMQRALELATLGRGHVSPNPMVGCVIVHEPTQRILGEGWHQRYGEAHAERNAILSVRPEDEALLPESTAYVTLEPCSHVGKQPPCADLLIEKGVGRVVCCNDDPNPLVGGQGFQKLRDAGITVERGLLKEDGRLLNARFFTFMEKQRPYIMLKWAETSDGFIAGENGRPVQISGPLSQRLVHRWRADEDAIMVGTNTARTDNPRLNVRLFPGAGKNPTRIVIDKYLRLDTGLNLFDNTQPTLCYNFLKQETVGQTTYVQLDPGQPVLPQLLADLYQRRIQSVLVEGGTTLLQSFIDAGLWDEMRVFRSPTMLGNTLPGAGVKAPAVQGRLTSRQPVGDDELSIYRL
ncbi:bifunctional diaminohydroxyphosphoribosylaminopyrimidine deaminase/5-amino-6-(5-phosphoribosylamino)uracil reductase RibD [Spirosoma utsteinense]|uniref:bifunctional diaminohydroxyphosphoribosylaminopyrimidine deaminase/5-amino-6-(5-phosphoribosylamino)uracil reductase RibD n=1 Tax=Spirosoma utsteinense TaxID=2585773 RepID=UPI0016451EAE|nr:bifunctional diaminohydroxyphosphoribosylaminopyrimidine deaminase/5-amino-6-(5-phosphoribosylamino)uracil reductase RibD [Spirosoma utsteinense]MBC3784098.1 pyrimidine deaminase domain of riboflavin biosynthesis protein RibD/pyrimidine reductase [Spirosoma utsteinense]